MFLASAGIFGYTSIASGLDVPLTVAENAGIGRVTEPITSGIPIPESENLLSTSSLGVFSGVTEIPAQFRVLARWGGAPSDATKPIKWVLVDFQATVTANGTAIYYLRSSGNGTASGPNLAELSSSTTITVNTGSFEFTVNKSSFNIFDTASLDLNGDGIFAPDEKIISSNPDNGSIIQDSDGINDNISSNDGLGDTLFKTTLSTPTEFTIEENGPMKAVIVVRGRYTSQNGIEHMKYTTRIYAYKGKSYVRVRHSYVNGLLYEDWRQYTTNPADDETTDTISIDFLLNLNAKNFILERDTGNPITGTLGLNDTVYVQQDDTNTTPSLTYTTNINGQLSSTEGRAEGYGDLSDASKGLTVSQKYFWQKYPKRMTLQGNGKLSLGLVPIQDTLWEAMGIGNEIMFYFHGSDRSQISNLVYGFNKNPLFTVASNTWYVNSGAFGVLDPDPSSRYPNYDPLIESNYGISLADRDNLKLYGATNFGGHCFDCSDLSFSNVDNVLWAVNYYDGVYQILHQFARTADLKHFTMGLEYAQHYMETDIYNIYPGYARYAPSGDKGGMYGISPSYRAEHRRDPHFEHSFGGPGLSIYYYLSGDERAKEIMIRGADTWVDRGLTNTGRAGSNRASWVLAAYLATYDSKYINQLTQDVNSFIDTYDASYFEGGTSIRQEMGLFLPFLYDLYKVTGNERYKSAIIRLADWAMTTGYVPSQNNFWHYYNSQMLLWWTSKMEYIPGFGFAYLASGDNKYLEFVEPFFVERLTERSTATDGWAKGSQSFRNTIHLQGILSNFLGPPSGDTTPPSPPTGLAIE